MKEMNYNRISWIQYNTADDITLPEFLFIYLQFCGPNRETASFNLNFSTYLALNV